MAETNLRKILTDVGLSEKEAAVYLAGLSLGPAKAAQIANTAGVKRTTVYPLIEALEKLGLMSVQVKGFKKLYVAENPERLEAIVDMRHRLLKESLGDLSALYNLQTGGSAIKHYEGLDAIRTVYNSLIEDVKPKEDYLIISSPAEWFKQDPEFFQDFTERRAKLDINIRCLFIESERGKLFKQKEKDYNLKAKFFPKSVSFTVNIVIIPKKIVFHQIVPPAWAMVIENKNIVKAHMELFDVVWGMLD